MRNYLGSILLIGFMASLALGCHIDFAEVESYQEAFGVYQREDNLDSVCEYIFLKPDTSYSHIKIVNNDTLINDGKFELNDALYLYDFNSFGDSELERFVNQHSDSTSLGFFRLYKSHINIDYDSWNSDFYKLDYNAFNPTFHPDTVPNDMDYCGFYLNYYFKRNYINYVVIFPDNTYSHVFVSETDTLSHSGRWVQMETPGRFWFLKNHFIAFDNWYSYGYEDKFCICTKGGRRVASVLYNSMVMEDWFTDLNYRKYPDMHSLVHDISNDKMPEIYRYYIQKNVFNIN